MSSFSIIITAGGIGQRMGSEIPKQFLELNDLPVLMHTIQRFFNFDLHCEILVTLPSSWLPFWQQLILKHQFTVPHQVIEGGIERYDSIKKALSHCTKSIVGVHDGVRPLVSHMTIQNCLKSVVEFGTGIPVLSLKESLRKVTEMGSFAVDRNNFVLVQTPQFFNKTILDKAYQQPFHNGITDDAGLVEEAGTLVALCAGNEENIKITTPIDLKLAELLLN
jgi:2-C-methyl-D-erythritol 4-phosphate cytidylyltransferase